MTDAISNYGRRAQSDPSLRSALDKTDRKAGALAKALNDVSTSAPASKPALGDQVQLSNVAARAMAEPDFDRAKVESIKEDFEPEVPSLDEFYLMQRTIAQLEKQNRIASEDETLPVK